jgi:hypothetical protein
MIEADRSLHVAMDKNAEWRKGPWRELREMTTVKQATILLLLGDGDA